MIKSVLCVGATFPGANSLSLFHGFRALGFQVMTVATDIPFYKYSLAERAYMRLAGKPYPHKYQQFNDEIIRILKSQTPQILFVVKGLWVSVETIEYAKKLGVKTIHFHPDFLFDDRYHTSKVLNDAITAYDVAVTPKMTEVAKYRQHGCAHVLQVQYAFDPAIHRPVTLSDADKSRYGAEFTFVGRMEEQRAFWLNEMAKQDYDLKVWGTNWQKIPSNAELRNYCTFQGVYTEDMAKVFGASGVALGFLTHLSSEQHTARTFEIPACRGFLLTERTEEQQALFKEGIEADFFSDTEELLEKVAFYHAKPELRESIRQKGYEKVLQLDATYARRIQEILAF
ncbi:glycosyltransferase [Listeria sp. ILCC797]|uniref:CgeB family protein n=1 Tax=Listeria sp. ILCC797 TaxID=1918333 RepID=UPI000B590DEB|nr:glycosyltransferase [Listeria sp. ILCC797]